MLPQILVHLPDKSLISKLKAIPGIKVLENKPLYAKLTQNLTSIHQPSVINYKPQWDGRGTTVVVVDTGLDYKRKAFGGCQGSGCKVIFVEDLVPNDGVLDKGVFHGTNVAGIVAGVAPGARLLGYDAAVTERQKDGKDKEVFYSSAVLEAISNSISDRDKYNIVAINLSIGDETSHPPCPDDPAYGAAEITMSGASMAAPHVAGAAAVLKSAYPDMKGDQLERRRLQTGKRITDERNKLTRPRLDLFGAVATGLDQPVPLAEEQEWWPIGGEVRGINYQPSLFPYLRPGDYNRGLKDMVTGLEWEILGKSGNLTDKASSGKAGAYCQGKGEGWRLPTRNELLSLAITPDSNPPLTRSASGQPGRASIGPFRPIPVHILPPVPNNGSWISRTGRPRPFRPGQPPTQGAYGPRKNVGPLLPNASRLLRKVSWTTPLTWPGSGPWVNPPGKVTPRHTAHQGKTEARRGASRT